MATAKKLQDSIRASTRDGRRTVNVEYQIEADTDADGNLTEVIHPLDLPHLPGIPAFGSELDEDPALVLSDYPRMEKWNDQTHKHWRLELEYREITHGGLPGFELRLGTSIRPELRDIWRLESPDNRFSFPGGIDFPTQGVNGDTGGFGIDAAGEPMTRSYSFHTIRFEWETVVPPSTALLDSMVNTRNAAPWRGYPSGSVYFLGADVDFVRSQGNQQSYLVHAEFVSDRYYHLVQRVTTQLTGQREVVADDGNPALENYVAKTVNWWQPFPFTSDFNTLNIPI